MKKYRIPAIIALLLLLLTVVACGTEAEEAAAPAPPTFKPPKLYNRQIVVLHSDNARELAVEQIDIPFVGEDITHVFYVGRLNADGRPDGEGTLAWTVDKRESYSLYCEDFRGGRLSGKFRYVSWKPAASAADVEEREFIDGEILQQAELQDRFGGPVWHGDRETEKTMGGMTMDYRHANGAFAGGELREGTEVAFFVDEEGTTNRYRQVYWRDEQADEHLEVARIVYGADC